MTDSCIDGLRLVSTSYHIGLPWIEWSEARSYIVCRALVDQGVIAGTATIGTRRKRSKNASIQEIVGYTKSLKLSTDG